MNASARTIEEARAMLRSVAAVVFDERRKQSESLLDGKTVLREVVTVLVDANQRDAAHDD